MNTLARMAAVLAALATAAALLLALGCGEKPTGTPAELLAQGRALAAKGELYDAVNAYAAAIESGGLRDDALLEALLEKARLQVRREQYDLALADMSEAMEANPTNPAPYRDLAWLLSTCPKAGFRDGQQALVLADKALSIQKGPSELEAKAAALAEVGRFGPAAETQAEAVALWKEKNDPAALKAATSRLERYQAGKPWYQSTS